MRHRSSIFILCGLLLAVAIAYQARRLWRRCGDEEVMALLAQLLPRDTHGDGVIITGARLLARQFLSFPYQCEADTRPVRGNVDLSKRGWQHVQYMVSTLDGRRRVSLSQP